MPSTSEFAAFHRIDPATAGKGVNLLAGRRGRLENEYVQPLVTEAEKLGITRSQLVAMIREGGE